MIGELYNNLELMLFVKMCIVAIFVVVAFKFVKRLVKTNTDDY